MSYSDKDKAKEHWNKSKENAHEAGQHAASAASTVGHDFRAAAGEAAEAGKYAARRLTPGEGEERLDNRAQRAADRAEEEGRTTYNKIKDSIGGFFGGAKEQARETGNEAAPRTDDAAHRAAGQANKGIDKTYGTRRDFHREADSAQDVKEKGKDALGSAKDTAVETKDAVVGGLSYIGGRLTAPVSGDEGKDREIADKAKDNVNRGADKLSRGVNRLGNAGEEAKEKAGEKKEQTKGFLSGVFGGNKGDDEARGHGKNLMDKASDTWSSTEDSVRDTYEETKDKVRDTYDSTKAKLREAAESVEPHSDFEAIKSSGGIPSNTADLLRARSRREMAELREHETREGMHTGTSDYLSNAAAAWNDGMTGEGTLGSVRAAADGAGPHATWK